MRPAMIPISHQHVSVKPADGTTMDLYVAQPADEHDRHAGVLVLQEIWGVNAHIRDVTDRFARLGYTAAAPDVFHRTAPGFSAPYTDMAGATHAQAVTAEQAAADLRATHDWLRRELLEATDEPRIASVGFCFGGALSFLANAELPLSAAVSFYGTRIPRNHVARAKDQHGPALLFWAGKDKHCSAADRRTVGDALQDAGKPYVDVVFGHADHGFFCDQRPVHDAVAAKESWALVTAFLESALVV